MRVSLFSSLLFFVLSASSAYGSNQFAVVCGASDTDVNSKTIPTGCSGSGSITSGSFAARDGNNGCQWFDITNVSAPSVAIGLICVTVTGSRN